MTVRSLVPVAAVALLLAVAGCSSPAEDAGTPASSAPAPSESATPTPTPTPTPEEKPSAAPSVEEPEAEPAVITIKDFDFRGPKSVAPGATIMVKNDDQSTHSVTSEDGAFVEVIVEGGGATGTFQAPSEPGKYAYVCKFHPEMVATLVVK